MGQRRRGGLLSLIWLLLACPPEVECVDDGQCDEREVCLGGTCFDVECTDGSHCPIEQRCTSRNTCAPGCGDDEDCLAGFVCQDRVCVEPVCETTELDCSVGELCQDGACERVEGMCTDCSETPCPGDLYCRRFRQDGTCTTDADCEEGLSCDTRPMQNVPPCTDHCPGEGTCVDGVCMETSCAAQVCLMPCDVENAPECPGGFLCQGRQVDEAGICYANCAYLLEQGLYP